MKHFSALTAAMFMIAITLILSLGAIESPDASISAAIARGITGLIILAVAARRANHEVRKTKDNSK